MIINTGGRTDTVQYYSDWLLNRFKEGFVYSRNPFYPSKVTHYELTPDKVDCVVFCSKNYEPILERLNEITDRFNTYFHYTITAYGTDIEPRVPSINKSIETLLKLEKLVGVQRIAWRYDPVLMTEKYTIDRHLQTFEYIAKQLAGHIDRCIFSFVEMYKKLSINMPELKPITDDEKVILAKGLGQIAARYDIYLQTCATKEDFSQNNVHRSGCMTLEILGNANGVKFKKLTHKGIRKNCNCMEARDIGAYDTCPNGCKYCYANSTPKKAVENYKLHDKNSPILLGKIKETDEILQGNQKTFIDAEDSFSLFL
ncbi:MAG: DUF1848 domain-containing protein [Alphaproteobacteria bacterium]|nr:DUF1848 domain-containing protein [Alphaproteobacteria bacterium]